MAETLTLIFTAGYTPLREPQDCDAQDDHYIIWDSNGWGFCRNCGTEYTFEDCDHASVTGWDDEDRECDDCGATAEGADGEWTHTLF